MAKHGVKVRAWWATGSDRDASQIPYAPNGTRGYTTTTTSTTTTTTTTTAAATTATETEA